MNRIVIFAKAPVAGKVKTRLIPALGADGAARLADQMLQDSYAQATAVPIAYTELCADPEPEHPDWHGHLPSGVTRLSAQGEGDLGERLARAAERVIGGGEPVLFMGTDCPGLDTGRLAEACLKLETHDSVLFPTTDGGYALLGLNRFHPSIFREIAWSTSSVAEETAARIKALGWSLHIGEKLRDIDEPADLVAAGIA